MNLRRSAAILGAAAVAVWGFAGSAQAATPRTLTCTGGDIASGTYANVVVKGACSVPAGADITITRNLKVAPGAMFDAQMAPSNVRIDGNVVAGRGSMFGLGCTPAHGCETGGPYSDASVGGNIVLNHVYDAALNGIEVGGNVVSSGGGAGFIFPDDFIPFSVKDDIIHGNLVVRGLTTTWFGVIRSTIDGNVILRDIRNDDPDGMEVVANTVGKNLICMGNSPDPQFGDAVGGDPSYGPNSVGGRAIGQCTSLVG